MIQDDVLNLRIDRESPYYKAATEAGFKFDEILVAKRTQIVGCATYAYVQGMFTCVCGNIESYGMSIDFDFPQYYEIRGDKIDIARLLERHGSFSESHLIMDGYNKEDIARIRAPFEALNPTKVKETNVGVFCA